MSFHRPIYWLIAIAGALSVVAAPPGARAALQPDEILLITNKNNPDSAKLADLYCRLQGVPSSQVVALDLPNSEEMEFKVYEMGLVGPVRQFLAANHLQKKVKCLLTFYGVPFRIKQKVNTPEEQQELTELKKAQWTVTDQLKQAVENLEKQAAALDPDFQPAANETTTGLLERGQAAIAAVGTHMAGITDNSARTEQLKRLLAGLETLGGQAEIDSRMGAKERSDPGKTPEQLRYWNELHARIEAARAEAAHFQTLRWDAEAREVLRKVCVANFGAAGTLRVLDAQINYLTTDATASGTDNELARLWDDYYPRQHWLNNPLNLQYRNAPTNVLMVMRLDGPDAATVERMMRTSVEVEKTGLKGIVAIDARGLEPIDEKGKPSAFGEFDQTLRDLAYLIRMKTDLKVKLDDQDVVFPPHSVKNVALYCGWYSVSKYVPGCDFNPGAVGYHIASFEMASLHFPSPYWVRGLLSDGVVGTLGPVAEPYLSAFPRPDQFFPLLLTGKLTLAEVYWKTTPMTSWMINFIGDPLYCPYKADPALRVEDLPAWGSLAFSEQKSDISVGVSDSSHTSN